MKNLIATALSRHVLPLLVASGALFAFALGQLAMTSAVFDFFAQFSKHWLVIAVTAVAASFIPRRAYTVLTLSFPLAILFPVGLAHYYEASPAAANFSSTGEPVAAGLPSPTAKRSVANLRKVGTVTPTGFRLLVFNTYNYNVEIDEIFEEIERLDADVLVLIEVGPNKRALLPRLRQLYPHGRACEDNWDCGVALLSRLPARHFKLVGPKDDAGPPYIKAELQVGDRSVTIIGTHVLSPNHGPRANFIELDKLAAVARRRQMPLIVAGDLNTTVWANAFDNFRRKSGLNHMGHLIPTWPVRPLPLPQIGIDHIFTSPELRVAQINAGNAAGSDHLPLLATIEFR
jgi:endonuclease/exonuclease/phosphatase (EEP) superfamily protein YafD